MIAVLNFAILAMATMLAIAAAAALHWLGLRTAFVLMQPATARRAAVRSELVRGSEELARAFAARRAN